MCLWLYQYIIWIVAVVAIFVFSIGFADSCAHCMFVCVYVYSKCACVCVSVSFGFKFLLIAICATMRRTPPAHLAWPTLPDAPERRRHHPADLSRTIWWRRRQRQRRLRSWAVKGHNRAEQSAKHFALDLLQFCSASVGSDVGFASQPLACAGAEAFGWASSASTTVRRCFESSFCVFTRIWYIFFSWVHLLLLLLLLLVLWGRFCFCSRVEAKSAPIF